MTINTKGEAVERLIEWQQQNGCVPIQPAWDDTIETDAGWAFFNVRGYLGTVTAQGDVIDEDQFDDEWRYLTVAAPRSALAGGDISWETDRRPCATPSLRPAGAHGCRRAPPSAPR